jgi:DNA-binding protein H-NS
MTSIQRVNGARSSYDGVASQEAAPAAAEIDVEAFANNPGLGLMALRIQSGAVHKKDLETRVGQEAQQRDELRKEQREAEAAAKEAQESSNKWGNVIMVAKVAAIAASVAASVVTGGSSLVIAAAIIGGCASVGGVVAEKCGASSKLCMGLEIGGAALSLGATAGSALGVGASQAAAQASASAAGSTARAILQGAGGAATATQGGAMIGKGHADGQVLDHNADALQARNGSEDSVAQQKDDLARLQRQATSDRQSTEAAIQERHQHAAAITQMLSSMRG